MLPTEPVPIPQSPTFWQKWGEVFGFTGLVVGTSIWMWQQPDSTHRYLLGVLLLGCLFDALSFFYYALTFIKRRFHSGLPGVGFLFCFWAWLAYPHPVLLAGGEGFWRIALAKLPDLLVLVVVQLLVHVPLPWFTRVRRPEIRPDNPPGPGRRV
jgi:hypothetical protein